MTFIAKYKGVCAEGDRIEPGQECDYTTDHQPVHVDCSVGSTPKVSRAARHCERCFLVHTGECF